MPRVLFGGFGLFIQISGGPSPVIEDLSPDRGNITFHPGQASGVITISVQDDKVILNVDVLQYPS